MNKEVQTQENALTVAEDSFELNADIFAGCKNTGVRKVISLDPSNEDDMNMLLNAQQDVDFKLNDVVGQEIECVGCYIVERPNVTFNEETGEEITRKKHVLMLFDKNRKSYVTASSACYNSFENIVAIKGLPTAENPLILRPIKVDAEEKGHSYLKLQIVIKKENK